MAKGERFGIIRIMVSIRLGTLDMAAVRFAFSPLWECAAAFRAWRSPHAERFHRPWAEAIDPVVRDADWSALDRVLVTPTGIIPDFVAPPPSRPLGRFGDELRAMLHVPAAVAQREMTVAYDGRLPDDLHRALRHPARFVKRVARELEHFWQHAVYPVWPRIAARLDADVVYRSRRLALGGAADVLRNLHSSVRYTGEARAGVVRVASADTFSRSARGHGLLLVPSVFAYPHAYAVARDPWRPTLAYPARGIIDVWQPRDRASSRSLMTTLLGATRARLLVRLVLPQTTAELAAALALSPASVSEHLGALTRAGATMRSRVGRQVFYALSERGAAVVEALARPERAE